MSWADAEEMSQETFFRACLAAIRFRGESTPRTWLFGIARNVWLEAVKAKRRKPQTAVSAHGVDHDERLDLQRAFHSLDESDRELLALVDIVGFSPSETAVLEGISPEALRVRLHRARARLRKAYLS